MIDGNPMNDERLPRSIRVAERFGWLSMAFAVGSIFPLPTMPVVALAALLAAAAALVLAGRNLARYGGRWPTKKAQHANTTVIVIATVVGAAVTFGCVVAFRLADAFAHMRL